MSCPNGLEKWVNSFERKVFFCFLCMRYVFVVGLGTSEKSEVVCVKPAQGGQREFPAGLYVPIGM
jgi:hypothetical protein